LLGLVVSQHIIVALHRHISRGAIAVVARLLGCRRISKRAGNAASGSLLAAATYCNHRGIFPCHKAAHGAGSASLKDER